jgi:tRNA uracil 4-sulfurtransferase
MRRTLVVHYAEIATKGRNRVLFERRLMAHLGLALRDVGIVAGVRRVPGRLTIDLPEGADVDAAVARLASVAGVASVAVGVSVPADLDAISREAVAALAAAPPGSFKLAVRRGDKTFPLDSIAVARAVGAACVEASGRRVDVHRPDVVVHVEIPGKTCYVVAPARRGPGGLPTGTTGRLLAFLSGGIDSPVAAWKLMRRGAHVTAVHFWNRTLEGGAVLEKLADLCRVLAATQGAVPLVVVPFEALQRAIVAAVPAEVRMVVYRRAMLRIGARLAERERALGFVTGDCLGQVASQTAENLRTIHAAATLPIHAPLCGDDKMEVVALARRIGTYEVSVRPHEDCCSFLVSEHPATRTRVAEIERLESAVDWAPLVEEALAGATHETHTVHGLRAPGGGAPASGAAPAARAEDAGGAAGDARTIPG